MFKRFEGSPRFIPPIFLYLSPCLASFQPNFRSLISSLPLVLVVLLPSVSVSWFQRPSFRFSLPSFSISGISLPCWQPTVCQFGSFFFPFIFFRFVSSFALFLQTFLAFRKMQLYLQMATHFLFPFSFFISSYEWQLELRTPNVMIILLYNWELWTPFIGSISIQMNTITLMSVHPSDACRRRPPNTAESRPKAVGTDVGKVDSLFLIRKDLLSLRLVGRLEWACTKY